VICADSTILIDLWRQRDLSNSPVRDLIAAHPGEDFVVPAHAAGEFLEGGANVSAERLAQSLQLLRLFRIGVVDLETAYRYAQIVAQLRNAGSLIGHSKPDLWIAAWAIQHGAPLATRNARHFEDITGLELIGG
jgi:predicted nucleic acid-binding protein